MIEPKRIHDYDEATPTELARPTVWVEVEVPGPTAGYINRKVSLPSIGGGETLNDVLTNGNSTDDQNILITDGSVIDFESITGEIITLPSGRKILNIAGNLIFETVSIGLNDGTSTNAGIRSTGDLFGKLLELIGATNKFTHLQPTLTDDRVFTYPDGDIDWTGGSEDFAMLQNADGSFSPKSIEPIISRSGTTFPASPITNQKFFHETYGLEFYYDDSNGRDGWYSSETYTMLYLAATGTFAAGTNFTAASQSANMVIPTGFQIKLVGIHLQWLSTSPGGASTLVNFTLRVVNNIGATTNNIDLSYTDKVNGVYDNTLDEDLTKGMTAQLTSIVASADGVTVLTLNRPILNLKTKIFFAS